MLFHSPSFFLFVALTALLFRVFTSKHARFWLLLLASLVWYASFGWLGFATLIVSVGAAHVFHPLVAPGRPAFERNVALLSSCLLFLGVYVYFRHFTPRDTYPIGLSFFLFQLAALCIDHYRAKRADPLRPSETLLFTVFFPQLVAGPIERKSHLLPQLRNLHLPSREILHRASALFFWGFFKKVAVADTLHDAAKVIQLSEGASWPLFLLSGLMMTITVYCDFSGYADMGRGVARLFGIELSLSFKPFFFARSPLEFWERWHISLGRWFRDYIVVPLMGRSPSEARKAGALLFSFLLMGAWHGLGWNWLLFGLFHGLAVILTIAGRRRHLHLPAPLAHVLMLGFFVVAGCLHAVDYSPLPFPESLSAPFGAKAEFSALPSLAWVTLPALLVLLLGDWLIEKRKNWLLALHSRHWIAMDAALFLLALALSRSKMNTFIYFNF